MIFLVVLIIGYIFIFSVGLYTLFCIYKYPTNFGTKLTDFLNFMTIFIAIFIYSTLFVVSVIFYFSNSLNLFLWKLSLITSFIGLMLLSLIYTFLKEFRRIPYFPFLYFTILFGLLIGSFFTPDSVNIIINSTSNLIIEPSQLNYTFSPLTGFIVILFQFSFVFYFLSLSYMIYKRARKKETVKALIINTSIFVLPILMYFLYIIYQIHIFRELHIILLWFNILTMCYVLIKKPEMLLELTNKIYYINIYHKSGILLYSYKFSTPTNEIDSTIWGNILIGINHILSEFVDPKDQIEVLQTDTSDIIVNYDEIGFAVVLITIRKNEILKKLMESFTLEFKSKFENELNEIQDLNKLINVSEFKETKDIVEKIFQMYL